MLLWRKFEDKLAALHPTKVRGFLHLYNGQEVLAGALHAMDLTKIK
jgi:TPP-dependent pyruvate/acetoin dehydrogenase alpha subunit